MEKQTIKDGLPEGGDEQVTVSHAIKMDKVYGDYTNHSVLVSVTLHVSRDVISNIKEGSLDPLAERIHDYVRDSTNRVLAAQNDPRQIVDGVGVRVPEPLGNPFTEGGDFIQPGTPAAAIRGGA